MQVLKEEVRRNILSAAKNLFYEKGYSNASIRDIAKQAGITEGNVYRYFTNKEHILEGIVQPAYDQIMELIGITEQMIDPDGTNSFQKFRDIINSAILRIAREFRLELLILFKGTTGTRFEKTRQEVIMLIEKRIYDGILKKVLQEDQDAVFLSKIIAHAFLDSMIMVISDVESNDKLEKMIRWLSGYFFNH